MNVDRKHEHLEIKRTFDLTFTLNSDDSPDAEPTETRWPTSLPPPFDRVEH